MSKMQIGATYKHPTWGDVELIGAFNYDGACLVVAYHDTEADETKTNMCEASDLLSMVAPPPAERAAYFRKLDDADRLTKAIIGAAYKSGLVSTLDPMTNEQLLFALAALSGRSHKLYSVADQLQELRTVIEAAALQTGITATVEDHVAAVRALALRAGPPRDKAPARRSCCGTMLREPHHSQCHARYR